MRTPSLPTPCRQRIGTPFSPSDSPNLAADAHALSLHPLPTYIQKQTHTYMHTCLQTLTYTHTHMHACRHHPLTHSLTHSLTYPPANPGVSGFFLQLGTQSLSSQKATLFSSWHQKWNKHGCQILEKNPETVHKIVQKGAMRSTYRILSPLTSGEVNPLVGVGYEQETTGVGYDVEPLNQQWDDSDWWNAEDGGWHAADESTY